MNTQEIRDLWTRFFAAREHRAVPSSSLIPPPDERSLLFTNAGMNQMKPFFMGLTEPPARRLTSIQKCFRTSDIEEVGDSSHCTFFEMLGNFSVGDYFKAEIIPWAWDLITSPQPDGLGLDPDRIWTTVFEEDDESFDLWHGVGIPAERIIRFDESENYWFMIKGGAGPCGPNSEIFYDFGADQGCGELGCTPPTHDCGRFLEIWNLVFMALYQEEDGKTRRPLPMRNVDTGAGIERWAVVDMYQHGRDWKGAPKPWDAPPSIFDTDLFQAIIAKVEELTGLNYESASEEQQRAMRVVAEHTRAATFLIADGVTPANDGRGYVLRRLIRRGTSYGQRLNQGQQFLAAAAETVIERMAATYNNLNEQREFVLRTLRSEEARFFETLWQGRSHIDELKRTHADTRQVSGSEMFQLWDTHGFPPELTQELLSEDGYAVSNPKIFETLMQEQRVRSRAAAQFDGGVDRAQTYAELALQTDGLSWLRDHSRGGKRPRHLVSGRASTGSHSCLRGRYRGRSDSDAVLAPKAAARSAIGANWCGPAANSSSTTRRLWGKAGSRPTSGASSLGRCGSAIRSRREPMNRAAPTRCATTPQPTSCTPRCDTSWVRTCVRPARWSRRTVYASTSPISRR